MREPTRPPGTRIFARVEQFIVECPVCGVLNYANVAPAVQRRRINYSREGRPGRRAVRRGFKPGSSFNPFSSRLRCTICKTLYGVGLLLWPVAPSGGTVGIKQPADQYASTKQWRIWAEERERAISLCPEEPKRMGEEMNLLIEGDCTCPPVPGGWAPGCPIHRWKGDEE